MPHLAALQLGEVLIQEEIVKLFDVKKKKLSGKRIKFCKNLLGVLSFLHMVLMENNQVDACVSDFPQLSQSLMGAGKEDFFQMSRMSETWGKNGSDNFSSEEKGFDGFAAITLHLSLDLCCVAVVFREITFTRNKKKGKQKKKIRSTLFLCHI